MTLKEVRKSPKMTKNKKSGNGAIIKKHCWSLIRWIFFLHAYLKSFDKIQLWESTTPSPYDFDGLPYPMTRGNIIICVAKWARRMD